MFSLVRAVRPLAVHCRHPVIDIVADAKRITPVLQIVACLHAANPAIRETSHSIAAVPVI